MDIGKQCVRLLVDAPANDAHLCRIPKASGLPFNRVLLMRSVNELMARLTDRHQVIGAIPARLAGLDVMNIEYLVFRLALTPLTQMPISRKDIFPDIPETELWTVLVVFTLDLRGAYLLDIELGHLDGGPAYR